MSIYFKTLFSLAVFSSALASAPARADSRDYSDKAFNSLYKRSLAAHAHHTNRSPVTGSEIAQVSVAEKPNTTRARSYEPSQQEAVQTSRATHSEAGQVSKSTGQPGRGSRSLSDEPSNSGTTSLRNHGPSHSGEFSIDVGRHAKAY
jgi:hypothetical protein